MIALLFFSRLILDNLAYGQVNLLVMALAVAHLYFFARGEKTISAAALVFAASIKITPALLLLYHVVKGRWRFAILCAGLIIAVNGLSFAPFGGRAPQALQSFVDRTVRNRQGFNLAYHGNQSLRGAIERLGGNQEAFEAASLPAAVVGVLFLALACLAAYRSDLEIAGAAPFFCCAVLLSPLSWKQHFVMLLLPVVSLLGEALRPRSPTVRRVFLVTLILVFALFNLTSPKVIGVATAEWCDAHSLIFAGAVMIFLACSATARKRE